MIVTCSLHRDKLMNISVQYTFFKIFFLTFSCSFCTYSTCFLPALWQLWSSVVKKVLKSVFGTFKWFPWHYRVYKMLVVQCFCTVREQSKHFQNSWIDIPFIDICLKIYSWHGISPHSTCTPWSLLPQAARSWGSPPYSGLNYSSLKPSTVTRTAGSSPAVLRRT